MEYIRYFSLGRGMFQGFDKSWNNDLGDLGRSFCTTLIGHSNTEP